MTESVADLAAELSIRADSAESRRASLWLQAVGTDRGVPPECLTRLDHCMDEALANVIAHGGPGALDSPIDISVEVCRDAGLSVATVTIVDAGIPFDPTKAHVKARPDSLADASPGGLGLLMMRSYADRIGYTRIGEHNQLTFMVSW